MKHVQEAGGEGTYGQRRRKGRRSEREKRMLMGTEEVKGLEELLFGDLGSDDGEEDNFLEVVERDEEALAWKLVKKEEVKKEETSGDNVKKEEEHSSGEDAGASSADEKEERRRRQGSAWLAAARERKRRRADAEGGMLDFRGIVAGIDADSDDGFQREEATSSEADASGEETGGMAALVATTQKVATKRSWVGKGLASGKLRAKRLSDLNELDRHRSAVSSVDFHPKSALALSSGKDKCLKLYQINESRCRKVESLWLEQLKVNQAAFTSDGTGVWFVGNNKILGMYDLESGEVVQLSGLLGRNATPLARGYRGGKRTLGRANVTVGRHTGQLEYDKIFVGAPPDVATHGETSNLFGVVCRGSTIALCSTKTRTLVKTIHLGAEAVAADFLPSSRSLVAADVEGSLYVYDFAMGRFSQKFTGSTSTSMMSMAVTPASITNFRRSAATEVAAASGVTAAEWDLLDNAADGREGYVATGHHSGYVDLYPVRGGVLSSKVCKSFSNLTTPVSCLKFHPSGDALFSASDAVPDACRMSHLPTLSVYPDWPGRNCMIGSVSAAAFSRDMGYFALGNATGSVRLYRLPL